MGGRLCQTSCLCGDSVQYYLEDWWVPVCRPSTKFHRSQLSDLTWYPLDSELVPDWYMSHNAATIKPHLSHMALTRHKSCMLLSPVIKCEILETQKSLNVQQITAQHSAHLHSCTVHLWSLTCLCEWMQNIWCDVYQQLAFFHYKCLHPLCKWLIW